MKYYYTDPLQAAWMLREFGIGYEGFLDKNSRWCQISDFTRKGAWYIHPDCHNILKPQVGDVISGITGTNLKHRLLQEVIEGAEEAAKVFMRMGCQIIQRNGKAFFMPEVEDA